MKLPDLGDALTQTLTLPVAGRDYVVPEPPARVGLWMLALQRASSARRAGMPVPDETQAVVDTHHDWDLYEQALGPVHARMVADGVPFGVLQHAGMTAYLWNVAGEQAARVYWEGVFTPAPAAAPDEAADAADKT